MFLTHHAAEAGFLLHATETGASFRPFSARNHLRQWGLLRQNGGSCHDLGSGGKVSRASEGSRRRSAEVWGTSVEFKMRADLVMETKKFCVFGLLVGLSSLWSGCTTEALDVMALLGACPLAEESVGTPASMLYSKTIGSAGVWSPPAGAGFDRKTVVRGSKDVGTIYHSDTKASMVLHTGNMIVRRLPNGRDQSSVAEIQVIDLLTCKTTFVGGLDAMQN
jgi:hypothetical protein